MKKYVLFFIILSLSFKLGLADEHSQEKAPFPQALPVKQQLFAVETGDVELFKSCYADKIQKRIMSEYKSWDEVFKLYREAMTNAFPGFRAMDFGYEYREVDSRFGVVMLKYKGARVQVAEMRVVLQNGNWKVAEK